MYDILVVGGGPAGLTAALYAARAGKRVAVLEQDTPGGQIVYAPRVENYPGLPGMAGAEFAARLEQQVRDLEVEILPETAEALLPGESPFCLRTSGGERRGRSLVLATGVSHRRLGLPGEEDLIGAGVSYCAVCDGAFYRGRDTAVVGGGDTALQEALFLAPICAKVTLIHRREQFRGEQRLLQQLRQQSNVEILTNHTVEALRQQDGVLTGLELRDVKGGPSRVLMAEGLFVAVGQVPHSGAFAGRVAMDEAGYFLAGEDTATDIPGVFAAGDCRKKTVRQLTTAVGDGAAAAMAACRFLDGGCC